MTVTALLTRDSDMSKTHNNDMSFATVVATSHVKDVTPADVTSDSDNDKPAGTSDKDTASPATKTSDKAAEKARKRHDKKLRQEAKAAARAIATSVNRSAIAYVILVGGLVTVATVNFFLSFIGLYDYGARVAKLPLLLPALVPLGIDGLAICAIGAIYLLRHAPLRIRAFCWAVFFIPTGLSILGNVSHAVTANLSAAGIAGSAVWPIQLAFSTHLVVVVVRYLERARLEAQQHVNDKSDSDTATPRVNDNDSDSDKPATSDKDTTATVTTPRVTRVKNVATNDNPTPAQRVTNPRNDSDKTYAQKRHKQGVTVAQIVQELVSHNGHPDDSKTVARLKRNVYRWTK